MKYVEQLHLVLHFPPFKLWTIKKLCDKFYLTKYYWMFWFYSAIYLRVSVSQSLSLSLSHSLTLFLSGSPCLCIPFANMCACVFIHCDSEWVWECEPLHMDLFPFYCCYSEALLECFSTSGLCIRKEWELVTECFLCVVACLCVIPLRKWYTKLLLNLLVW